MTDYSCMLLSDTHTMFSR